MTRAMTDSEGSIVNDAAERKSGHGSVKIPSYLRICYTVKGPVRLTPTEMQILSFIHKHEDRPVSKSQIAAALDRNEKTISRLVSRLRQYQIIESVPTYAENGAQLANAYRLVGLGKKE